MKRYLIFGLCVVLLSFSCTACGNSSHDPQDDESVEEQDPYLLPDSDSRYYTEEELADWDEEKLGLARNEIFARHGYIFETEEFKNYFEDQSWYEGTVNSEDFDNSVLNDYENANIELIKKLENGGFSFSDIDNMSFTFANGHGAWGTLLTTYGDGTFEGIFDDWDGVGTDSNGIEHNNVSYHNEFSGKFSEIGKIDDYSFSTSIESLSCQYPVGVEETIDDKFYIYSDPYGVSEGDEVIIYVPGMRIVDLPEEVINWIYSSQSDKESITDDMLLEYYVIWDTNGGIFQ